MTARLGTAGTDVDLDWPDVYFTPGYGSASAVTERAQWRLLHHEGRILVPYLVRRIDATAEDAISPYGYSGVHVPPGTSAVALAEFWSAALAYWRATGLVSVFFRFSPLDQHSVDRCRALDGLALQFRGTTVTVPVDVGAPALWSAMAGRSRTAVRKAHKTGHTAGIRPVGPDDLAAGSPFRRLYEQTMRRVGSRPEYLFPDRYYSALAAGCGKGLHVAEVTRADGEVVASALVLRHASRAHYHLSGSDPVAARDGANNLLLWTILAWAAESSCAVVHLGGGITPGDRLFDFKRSFGGQLTAFYTASVVLDPDRYAELVAARAAALARPVTELTASGFFPAYRLGGER